MDDNKNIIEELNKYIDSYYNEENRKLKKYMNHMHIGLHDSQDYAFIEGECYAIIAIQEFLRKISEKTN